MNLLDLYAPPRCPICNKELSRSEKRGVCSACERDLSTTRLDRAGRCSRCFTRLDPLGRCSYCGTRRVYFDSHASLYHLTDESHTILRKWKFENERRLFRIFIEDLRKAITPFRTGGPVHFAYIQSGRSGRDLRAYQPCQDLCRVAASSLPEASQAGSVYKQKKRKQSGVSYLDRFFSVHGSLAVKPIPYGRPVILIEDLYTTGATANEAARLLKNSGAVSVHLISMLFHDREISDPIQSEGVEHVSESKFSEPSNDSEGEGACPLYRKSA